MTDGMETLDDIRKFKGMLSYREAPVGTALHHYVKLGEDCEEMGIEQ